MADWIPCKDRLPTENGEYLCSLKDGILHDIVIFYYVADPKSFVEKFDLYGLDKDQVLNGGIGWYEDCGDDFGYVKQDDRNYDIVIAWQPLPEPYEETDNGT